MEGISLSALVLPCAGYWFLSMDIRINLLPAELLGQQKKKQNLREWTLFGGIVVGVFLLVYIVLVILTWQVRSEASTVRKKRLDLEGQVSANQSYAVLRDKVAQADKLIGTALGATPDWSQIMSDIKTNMPINIQLTAFSVNKSKNQAEAVGSNKAVQGQIPALSNTATTKSATTSSATGELDLQGLSANYASVGEWLEGMNKLPYLSDVRCLFSSKEEHNGQKVVRFEIKATLVSDNSQAGKAGASSEH